MSSIRFINDRETQRFKGIGYAEFESHESAVAALGALPGTQVEGREIRVDWATQKAPGGGDRGGGGGGGFRGGRGGDRGGRGGGFRGGDRGFGGGRGGGGGGGFRGGRGGGGFRGERTSYN